MLTAEAFAQDLAQDLPEAPGSGAGFGRLKNPQRIAGYRNALAPRT